MLIYYVPVLSMSHVICDVWSDMYLIYLTILPITTTSITSSLYPLVIHINLLLHSTALSPPKIVFLVGFQMIIDICDDICANADLTSFNKITCGFHCGCKFHFFQYKNDPPPHKAVSTEVFQLLEAQWWGVSKVVLV